MGKHLFSFMVYYFSDTTDILTLLNIPDWFILHSWGISGQKFMVFTSIIAFETSLNCP